MTTNTPSPKGGNGRTAGGRFAKGYKGGPGNPHARRVGQLRAVLLGAVTDEDLKAVIAALLNQAKAGDIASIRELLQRLLGPPVELDFIERMEALEQRIEDLSQPR